VCPHASRGEASKKYHWCHPYNFSGIVTHFWGIFLVLRKRSRKSLVSSDTNAYMLAPPLHARASVPNLVGFGKCLQETQKEIASSKDFLLL
jgi:hypothetical protein